VSRRRIPRTCLPLAPLEAEIARLRRRRNLSEAALLGNTLQQQMSRARARRWPTRLIPIEQAEAICWHLGLYPDVLYGAAWHRAVDRAVRRADELAARKAARKAARRTRTTTGRAEPRCATPSRAKRARRASSTTRAVA
jgi:hypothetical protein